MPDLEERMLARGRTGVKNIIAVQGNVRYIPPVRGVDRVLWKHRPPPWCC